MRSALVLMAVPIFAGCVSHPVAVSVRASMGDAGSDGGSIACSGPAMNCCDPTNPNLDCNGPIVGPATRVDGTWTCESGGFPTQVCTGICIDPDSGVDAGPDCGTMNCPTGDVCVTSIGIGGIRAPITPDAGTCPSGYVVVGLYCAQNPSYSCEPRPTHCGTTLDCSCASDACVSPSGCSSTGTGRINCVVEYP